MLRAPGQTYARVAECPDNADARDRNRDEGESAKD